jgi:hypothetical protein
METIYASASMWQKEQPLGANRRCPFARLSAKSTSYHVASLFSWESLKMQGEKLQRPAEESRLGLGRQIIVTNYLPNASQPMLPNSGIHISNPTNELLQLTHNKPNTNIQEPQSMSHARYCAMLLAISFSALSYSLVSHFQPHSQSYLSQNHPKSPTTRSHW